MLHLFGFNRDSSGAGVMCKTDAGEIVEFVRYENLFFRNGLIVERCIVRTKEGTEKSFSRTALRGRLPNKSPRRKVDPPWLPFAFFAVLMVVICGLIAIAFMVDGLPMDL